MARISERLRQQVIERAERRCEYCHAPLFVLLTMEVDHIIPTSQNGATELDNLCLSCDHCNGHKLQYQTGIDPDTGEQKPLFNPRTDNWKVHFQWIEDGNRIQGLTAVGRATIQRLDMNRQDVIEARGYWIVAGWYPPQQEASD